MTHSYPTDEQVEKALRAWRDKVEYDFTGENIENPYEAMSAALSAVNPFEWMPIESAPKDGRSLLLACRNPAGSWSCEGYYHESDHCGWYLSNTHWTDATDGSIFPTDWMPPPHAGRR